MSAGRAKVVVDIEANVNQINNALKSVQSNLSKLNLPPAAEKGFNKLFSNLEAEITNFRAKASSALTSQQDVNKFVKSWERIVDLYRQLGVQVKNLDVLSNNQKLTLIPGDTAEKFKKITAALKTYEQQINQTNNQIKKQTTGLNEAQKKVDKFSTKLNELKSQKNILNDEEFNKFNKEAKKAEATLEALAKRLESAKQALDNAPKTSTGKVDRRTKIGSEAVKEYNLAKQAYDDQKTVVDEARLQIDGKVKKSTHSRSVEEYTRKLSEAKERVDAFQQSLKKLSEVDTTQHFEKLKQELINITGVDVSAAKSIDELREAIAQLSTKDVDAANKLLEQFQQDVSKISPDIKKMGEEVEEASKSFSQLVQEQNSIDQLKNRLVSFFSIGSVIQTFRRAIRSAYESVKELDAVMTETAVVTEFDVGDMWEQLPQYTDMANELGASVKGAYETLTLFYQQGLNTEQAIQLGTETMKMARIANLDYATATDYMTAALRGFNMELNEASATRVNDVYSKLAAITASDTREISIAMTKTASIANNANMELETTAALLSQIIETTREAPETAGTAMKTIIARFQELKKAPGEIGEVDGEVVDANKIEGALRTIGVALRDANGQFRNLDDVFLDIAKKWKSLDTNTQRYIATMAAGSRQQSRFIAMMSDYERTMELVNAANNSAGASQKQFEKTTESLEAKINRLKNSWDTFVQGLANSSFIKASIDALTFLLNILNKITDIVGANTIGDFAITLTLIVSIFSKLRTAIDGAIKKYQAFSDLMKGGKGLKAATQTATTAGSSAGFTTGAAEAIPGMTAAVAEATENGVMAGLRAAYAQMKGYKALPAPSTNPIPGNPGEIPLLGDGKNPKGFELKFKELIDTKFKGSMKKFGLTLAGAAVAAGAVTKGLTWLLDKGITTAGEELEKLGELKDLTQTSLDNIDEKINSVGSSKQSYEHNKGIASVTYSNDKNHIQAVKSNNELIRTIRSEFPKLAKYTKYQNGQWNVESQFWKEYESELQQQRESLDNLTNALQAEEETLSYEQKLSDGIKTTDISDSEQKSILKTTEITAGIGATVATIAALLAPAMGPLAIIGTAAAGAAGVGLLGAVGSSIWAQQGISKDQFNYQASVLSSYGELDEETATKLEKYYQHQQEVKNEQNKPQDDIKPFKTDEIKLDTEELNLLNSLGGAEAFHTLYSAVDGNIDTLNEQVYEYQNLKSAQEEFRIATLRAAGALGDEPEDNGEIIKYSEVGLSDYYREQSDKKATSNWNKLSDDEKEKNIKEAMTAAGATYNDISKTWSKDGQELKNDDVEDFALEKYKSDQWIEYSKGFAEQVRNEGSEGEIAKLYGIIQNLDSKQRAAVANGDYSDIAKEIKGMFDYGPTGGNSAFGGSGIKPNAEFDNAVQQILQSDYIKNYDKVGNGLKDLAEKTGKPQFALNLQKMGIENGIGKELYNQYNAKDTTEEQKKAIEDALNKPMNSLDDVQDMMAQLREAGVTLNTSASELVDKFSVKDLGSTITSETISTISDKLTSGSALSQAEASKISEALGHGTIYEEMTTEDLSAAGFTKTDDGYILNGITAAEAIQALNSQMVQDTGTIREILENKYGDQGIDKKTVGGNSLYSSEKFDGMDINQAYSTISQTNAAQQNLSGTFHQVSYQGKYGEGIGFSEREWNNTFETQTNEDGTYNPRMTEEASKALDEYLDKQLAVTDATALYKQKLAELKNPSEKEIQELKKQIVTTEQLKKKLSQLSATINDVSEDLNSSDPAKYAKALDKIAAAAQSQLGLNLTTEQVAQLKDEFLKIAEGGDGVEQAIANIAAAAASNTEPLGTFKNKLKDVDTFATDMSNQTYSLYMTGNADFSGLFQQLTEAGAKADEAAGILQSMAGSGVRFKVTYEKIPVDNKFLAALGFTKTVPRITAEYVGGDAARNYTPSGGSGKSSGGGGGKTSSKDYENKYDKRYNLVEDITEEQRTLNKLEAEYQALLEGSNTSAQKLLKNYDKQVSSLEKQEKLNQKLLTYRKNDMKFLLSQNSKYSQYATYNKKDNTIEINWDKINKIKSSDKGEKVDEYISKLEEAQSRIEEVEDTLLDIKQTIKDLGDEQVDAYISSLNQVKDALVEAQQQQIDKLSKLNDTINDQNSRMFNAIQKSIDDERQARENDKTEQDIADKERRLAQLQMDTTGGNQTEILALQKEIDEAREGYGDSLVDQQLARMQEEADQAAEQRERQISLMEEQLDLYQSTGEVWRDVYDLWATGFTSKGKLDMESPLGKLLMNTADYMAMSQEERNQTRNEWGELFGQGKAGQKLFLKNQDNLDMAKELEAIEKKKKSTQSGIDYSQMNDSMRSAYKNQVIAEGKKRVKSGKATKNEKAKWGNTKDEGTSNNKPTSKLNKSAKGKISSITSNVNEDTPWYRKSTENLQKGINALIADGFIDGIAKLETDGEFGPKTKKAVQALQRLIGVDDDGRWGPASRTAFSESKYKSYKTGGLADFTGPAWLDGTKSHPELVLNARDTENFIQLKDILSNVLKRDNNKTENSGDNYFEIHIDVERIEDDYDVEQLADKIKGIIQQDAMYRNVNVINRLR